MKRILVFICFILISNTLFAKTFDDILGKSVTGFSSVNSLNSIWDCYINVLENQKLELIDYDNQREDTENWNKIYKYEIIIREPYYYLRIYSDNYDRTFLMLISEYLMILYTKDSIHPYFIGVYNLERGDELGEIINCNSTTYLSEVTNQYFPKNLSNQNLNSPWCEGVEGYGIGEKIDFFVEETEGIAILNGYVSYMKDYLYNQNSRIKLIKIELVNLNYSFEQKIMDTPNPQFIDFQKEIKEKAHIYYTGKVIITILDVYKGSKYQDTCINSIVTMNPIDLQ